MSTQNKVMLVTDETFESVVLQSTKPVVVSFTATWNDDCKTLAPALSALAEGNDGLAVAKIDVGGEFNGDVCGNPDTLLTYDIKSLPTVLLFRNGKVAHALFGNTNADVLQNWVDEHLNRPEDSAMTAEQFREYQDTFFANVKDTQEKSAIRTGRRIEMAATGTGLAGAGLLTALAGPYGALVAAPVALVSAWKGAQAVVKRDAMPQPVKSRTLSAAFNASATATGMGLMMAPVGNMAMKVVCIALAGLFMATGSLGLISDVKGLFGKKAPATPGQNQNPAP